MLELRASKDRHTGVGGNMPEISEEDVKAIDVVLHGMAVFILDLEKNKAAYLASDHALAQVFGTVVHRQAENARASPVRPAASRLGGDSRPRS